jgi:RimJ/RimL family protein N-acetyltransferase
MSIDHLSLRFETARLILRSFEDRDAQAFADYRSDPEIARYQGWEAPYSLAQAIQFVEEMKIAQPGAPGKWHQLAMELKDTGQIAGDCAFQVLREDARQAEIGITLARASQGQGYATESLTRLLDYLFNDLHMHRVRANIDPQNLASARLMERLGLRHEGRFIDSLWLKGEWRNEDWYAILRREWKKSPGG